MSYFNANIFDNIANNDFYNTFLNFHVKYAPNAIDLPKYGIPIENL